MKTFVKSFSETYSLAKLEEAINAHLRNNPELEVVSVSHSIGNNGSMTFHYTALIVFREKADT